LHFKVEPREDFGVGLAAVGARFMSDAEARRLLAAAESGDAEASYLVGCGYTHGQSGFSEDIALGRRWLMRAAELSAEYEGEIAMWVFEGTKPFGKDEARGLSMLRTAVARGDAEAALWLAIKTNDRETLVEIASAGGLNLRSTAALALFGTDEAGRYHQWTIYECKDPEQRKKVLLRRLDPKSSQGMFPWRPPWLKA
jgi:TPR repeat protein